MKLDFSPASCVVFVVAVDIVVFHKSSSPVLFGIDLVGIDFLKPQSQSQYQSLYSRDRIEQAFSVSFFFGIMVRFVVVRRCDLLNEGFAGVLRCGLAVLWAIIAFELLETDTATTARL
jgi:hypothetical protein